MSLRGKRGLCRAGDIKTCHEAASHGVPGRICMQLCQLWRAVASDMSKAVAAQFCECCNFGLSCASSGSIMVCACAVRKRYRTNVRLEL